MVQNEKLKQESTHRTVTCNKLTFLENKQINAGENIASLVWYCTAILSILFYKFARCEWFEGRFGRAMPVMAVHNFVRDELQATEV